MYPSYSSLRKSGMYLLYLHNLFKSILHKKLIWIKKLLPRQQARSCCHLFIKYPRKHKAENKTIQFTSFCNEKFIKLCTYVWEKSFDSYSVNNSSALQKTQLQYRRLKKKQNKTLFDQSCNFLFQNKKNPQRVLKKRKKQLKSYIYTV